MVMPGPSGHPTLSGMVNRGSGQSPDGKWSFVSANHAIDALNSLYVTFDGLLQGKIAFGSGAQGGEYYIMKLEEIPHA
jgi:hypothetical protein